MRSTKTSLGALAALLLCSTLAAQTAPEVKCGMMVMTSVTLTADLNCPSLASSGANAVALMIVGNGVEVNLNGHAVTGGGKGVGIYVFGADNISILDGEIRGFEVGVMVTTGQNGDRAYSPQLSGLRLTGNSVGAYLVAVRFGEISNSEISQNTTTGIVLSNATEYTVVTHNLVYANAIEGIAVGCEPPKADQKNPSVCDGLRANDNRIEANSVIGNGWTKGTNADANSGIIITYGDRNLVRHNLVLGNNTTTDGGQLSVTRGITLGGGTANVVTDNSVVANGFGIEVRYYPSDPPVYATNTVISRNTVMYNLSSGIIVAGEGATGAVISDNNALANGYAEKTGFEIQCRSGIRVQGAGATIMNNRAYDNIGYGLHVETKDIKAQYGNRAVRNGAATQCSGLTCP